MKTKDNFLSVFDLDRVLHYIKYFGFNEINVGGKLFSYLETPPYLYEYLQIDNHELILTFIRKAYKGFDNDIRIHADNIIQGEKTALASVLYLSDDNLELNGTMFYKHHKYNDVLPKDVTNEEFDRLIIEDSNNESLWKQTQFVQAKQNRLLTYNSNRFHSKYPKEIQSGERIVLVAFYKKSPIS